MTKAFCDRCKRETVVLKKVSLETGSYYQQNHWICPPCFAHVKAALAPVPGVRIVTMDVEGNVFALS